MELTKEQAISLASARLRLQQKNAEPKEPSFLDKLGHATGYQAKAAIEGAMALPAMGGDLLAYPINAVSRLSGGQDVFPPQRQAVHNLLTNIGMPDPQNDTEKLFAAGAGGIGAAASGVGLGSQLVNAANPAVAGVGNILKSAPASQVAAGASGSVSSEIARQHDYGPLGQSVAGIAGGIGGGLAAQKTLPAAWNAPQNVPLPSGAPNTMQLPRNATQTRPLAGQPEKSAFGNLKEVYPDEVVSNIDRTAQYRKAVNVLDKYGVELTKGQRSGSDATKMTETTLAQVPVIGSPLQKLFDQTRQSYQKVLLKLAGNENGDAMITPESLKNTGDALSRKYSSALANKSVSISDDAFLNDLATVEARHTDLVDQHTASKVKQIVTAFLEKASKEGAYSGEKYQAQRSLFAKRAAGNSEQAQLYGDLKTILDDAFHRAAGANVTGKINSQWAQYKLLQEIFDSNGGPLMSEGFISPVQVARRASGSAGSQEWKDFTRAAAAVIPDRLANSGTAQRQMVLNAAKGGTLGGIGTAGLVTHPIATALSMGGARAASSYLAKQPGQGMKIMPSLAPVILPSAVGGLSNLGVK